MYSVKKKFPRSEIQVGQFKTQAEAENRIQKELADDILYKIEATYLLLEGFEVVREFSKKDAVAVSDALSDSASSGGAGQRSSFSPTPYNMAPRPGGIPHNWIKDKDEKDK